MNTSNTLKDIFKIKRKKIPQTVQESIPYEGAYENGIIQLEAGRYSKMYSLGDLNFTIESRERQKEIFQKYMDFLGSLGPEVELQILIYNKSISRMEIEQKILIPMKNDSLNEYREEMNNMLIEKMSAARNNIIRDKYLILSTEADDIEAAKNIFSRIDAEIAKNGQRLTGTESNEISIIDRLAVLSSIYNMDSEVPFYQRVKLKNGELMESVNLKHLKRMGITTKDVIAPPSMEFENDHFKLGDTYGRAMFLYSYPSYLRGDVLTELSDMPFNMLTTVHYRSLPQEQAIKLVKERTVNINSNMVEHQKRASKNGYSPDLISPEVTNSALEVKNLMDDLMQDNQKIFMITVCMTIFAESKELLDKYTRTLENTAERFICQAKKLTLQQELGFNSCLPLGKNYLKIERIMNTRGAAIFLPFSVKEIIQQNGFYYGINAVSKQIIIMDRTKLLNGNGVHIGNSGSGKSMVTKRMIAQLMLSTDADIYVIDPENEYLSLAELLHGSCIRIAPGSGVYINPMDIDLSDADSDDPVTLKADFICSLCETASGSRYPLSPAQKTIIDRCTKNVYQEYIQNLRRENKAYDNGRVPTLKDLYNELKRQPEPEAHNIALTLERFVDGTLDTFAHRTNVDIHNRFVVYNIKDIGSGMKNLGLQICLDHLWNKMHDNYSRKKKATWIVFDEFHLLFASKTSAKYAEQLWRRARKWNGFPNAVTQHPEEILRTEEGRNIIGNSSFIVMMNMYPLERAHLQEILGISPTELEYITNSPPGQGLIFNGTDIIPFIDEFPKDTKLYGAMTTKPGEK